MFDFRKRLCRKRRKASALMHLKECIFVIFKNIKSTKCEMLAKDNGYQCATIAPSTLIFPWFGKIEVFAVLCR